MRRKSLWKNLMLATALTVVLGTAPVTAFAADVDSTVTEAEQTTPQADTTVKEEVAEPEVKAITVDVTTSSTTFDGTQDIVITYTVNGVQDGFASFFNKKTLSFLLFWFPSVFLLLFLLRSGNTELP